MPADESSFSAASSSSTGGAGSAASGANARVTAQVEADVARLVKQGVSDLEKRKRSLELEIEKLERRRDRIDAEMKTTFAGASQDLAVRVQGFKEYLVGSLQDLAAAAEQLDMQPPAPAPRQERERAGRGRPAPAPAPEPPAGRDAVAFAESRFQQQTERIRSLLDQYRLRPDYYGPVWQLRRTFEPIHGERVANWFFSQGGRGALKSLSSRLQNALVSSAIISILYALYGDRLRVLMLANTPERLGNGGGVFKTVWGWPEGILARGAVSCCLNRPSP
jgi:hypothetical protein